MRPLFLAVVFLALAISAIGCGGGAPVVRPTRSGPLTARELYPMGEEYIWTYDIDTGTGLTTLGIRRVVRAEAPRFTLQMDGERDEHVYELREGGIYDVGESLWVLRDPITVGQEWPSRGGRTARITEVGQEIDVGAGHFEDCIEVRETGSETGPDFRTVYCPEQGPVLVESHQSLQLSERGLTVRSELRMEVQRGMEDVEQPEEIEGPGR